MIISPGNCIVDKDKQGFYHVINPDECSDKELVRYLNCNNMMISLNERPKECR